MSIDKMSKVWYNGNSGPRERGPGDEIGGRLKRVSFSNPYP